MLDDYGVGRTFTVNQALHEQLLFYISQDSKQVTVPPIMLYFMYNRNITKNESAATLVIKHSLNGLIMSSSSSSSSSKEDHDQFLYFAVLVHRLRAAKLLGYSSISLYQLLGVEYITGQCDVPIAIDDSLVSLSKTVKTMNSKHYQSMAYVNNEDRSSQHSNRILCRRIAEVS
jgi:hypothetical protein